MATLFCPSCSNLLVISAETGFNKWACNTCPYEFPITKQMTSRARLERKQVDDVLGGEEMWKHADSTASKLLDSFFTFLPVTPRSSDGSIPWFWVAIYPVFTNFLRVPVRVSVQSLVKSVNTAEHTSTNYKSGLLMNL